MGLAATQAAQRSVQPLLPGKWPKWARGPAYDVEVAGNYAYVVLQSGGLAVLDVSNPTNCVQTSGYDTSGSAWGVAVAGNYA